MNSNVQTEPMRVITSEGESSFCAEIKVVYPLHERTVSPDASDFWSAAGSVESEDDTKNASPPCSNKHRNVWEDYHVSKTVLGAGKYGCVRECVCRSTGRRLAIKSIKKAKVGRLDHLDREVALLREVDHPSIMKMVDSYEDSNYVHIVTERYDGGELFDKIINSTTGRGCLPEGEAAHIIQLLLEAVQYLHDRDIVHRDIKPENILLECGEDADGAVANIRLIDFGLSQRHRRYDASMTKHVGTAYYTSPETLKGKYDRSCDLWSVGVVTFIMLAGHAPYNGETDADIHAAIREGRFDVRPCIWTNISGDAKDFIKCLLRGDPRRRSSAEEALRHPWITANQHCRRPRNVSF